MLLYSGVGIEFVVSGEDVVCGPSCLGSLNDIRGVIPLFSNTVLFVPIVDPGEFVSVVLLANVLVLLGLVVFVGKALIF